MEFRMRPAVVATTRRFVGELATITCGILIALAFDGVVQSRQERKVAREAAANIEQEMRDNQKQIETLLSSKTIEKASAQIKIALAMADAVLAHRESKAPGEPPKETHFELTVPFIALSDTSRTTALETGAMAHMPYADARRYAKVYGIQQELIRLFQQLSDHFVQMLPLSEEKLEKQRSSELERWRLSLMTTLQYLHQFESYARALATTYRDGLAKR